MPESDTKHNEGTEEDVFNGYTIVQGQRELVGVYKGNDLIATHDKFTRRNGDLARYIQRLLNKGYAVRDVTGSFNTFQDIPQKLELDEDAGARELDPSVPIAIAPLSSAPNAQTDALIAASEGVAVVDLAINQEGGFAFNPEE